MGLTTVTSCFPVVHELSIFGYPRCTIFLHHHVGSQLYPTCLLEKKTSADGLENFHPNDIPFALCRVEERSFRPRDSKLPWGHTRAAQSNQCSIVPVVGWWCCGTWSLWSCHLGMAHTTSYVPNPPNELPLLQYWCGWRRWCWRLDKVGKYEINILLWKFLSGPNTVLEIWTEILEKSRVPVSLSGWYNLRQVGESNPLRKTASCC